MEEVGSTGTLKATEAPTARPNAPAGEARGGKMSHSVRLRSLWVGGALLLLAALAVAIWLVVESRDDESSGVTRAPAAGLSVRDLNAVAVRTPHPVYWVGAQPNTTYELSRTKDGRIYIRYLPAGVKVGDSQPKYLSVGTYPQKNAFATLQATAKKQGAPMLKLSGGGLAFQDKTHRTSLYLAYPGSDYQVEVYDPSPARAHELVQSGHTAPIATRASARANSSAASVAELKALAGRVGHAVYWAGAEADTTYEVTRTANGRVYIRYLPQGVKVGSPRPDFLTIGTYPQRNALKILRSSAAKNDATTIQLDGGGLASIDPKHPTSVYVAYPNVDVQVEVYDPDAARARRLASSLRISSVG
jgi:hypothetical protein